MDNSEKPICKDCKYYAGEYYHDCHHPSNEGVINSVVYGKYKIRVETTHSMRWDNLKCGPNANFFEYSKWAKLKIKIKEVFTFG